jgi:hypothetical protein
MVIDSALPRLLGAADSVLRFDRENEPENHWPGRRLLFLRNVPAFELSPWCGTCPLLFKRLEGANETLSQEELAPRLRAGLHQIDDAIVQLFGALLPRARYRPMLLTISPQLVMPHRTDDYFSGEQVATWGIDSFWGLPEYTQTPYYRTWQTGIDADQHIFEFVVPMVPPTWNTPGAVRDYARVLAESDAPTAVAVSLLDIAQPAVREVDEKYYYAHWGLQHFLLDGHHKLHAAAESGRPVRLLSLLSLDHSLASADDLERVVELRKQQDARRH